MVAAEHAAVRFQPVADDAHLAMLAGGRELVDRALEAVEGVALAALRDLECLVVVVTAGITLGHGYLHSQRPFTPPCVRAASRPGLAMRCAGPPRQPGGRRA